MKDLLVVEERFDYNDTIQKIDLIQDFLRNIIHSKEFIKYKSIYRIIDDFSILVLVF
jgi:hypothetical protein